MPISKHRSDLLSILRGEVEMRFLLSFDIVTCTDICKLCALSYMVIQRNCLKGSRPGRKPSPAQVVTMATMLQSTIMHLSY